MRYQSLLLLLLVICSLSCSQGRTIKKFNRKNISVTTVLNEKNQLSLTNSLMKFDSCYFAFYGDYWSKKHPLIGIGYLENKVYTIQILFNKNYYSSRRTEDIIKEIKEKEIVDRKINENLSGLNLNTILNLNKDSLKIRSRGIGTRLVNHCQYAMIFSTIRNKFNLIYLPAPKYYQSNAPTVERSQFLKTIDDYNRLFEIKRDTTKLDYSELRI